MLYVKNLVFLDGAIARLAPDLDILAEIASISMMFAQRHGEQLGRELGIRDVAVDLDGVKAGFGLDRASSASPTASCRPADDDDDPATDARPPVASPGVRLVIARCSVDYAGRLSAHWPRPCA